VITGSNDGTAKQYDLERGVLLILEEPLTLTVILNPLIGGVILRTFAGHSGSVDAMALSVDHRVLITCSHDGILRQFEALTLNLTPTLTLVLTLSLIVLLRFEVDRHDHSHDKPPNQLTRSATQDPPNRTEDPAWHNAKPSFCYGCMLYGHLPKK